MSIRLVVAVTDSDWFETLRRLPTIDEVNFWAPSGKNFRALRPGELFRRSAGRQVVVMRASQLYASSGRVLATAHWTDATA